MDTGLISPSFKGKALVLTSVVVIIKSKNATDVFRSRLSPDFPVNKWMIWRQVR